MRSPRAARASMAARGAPTMANSAATNSALARINSVITAIAVSMSVIVARRRRDDRERHLAVVDAFDFDVEAADLEVFSGLRHSAGAPLDEVGDRHVLDRPRAFQPDARAFERQRTGQTHASVREPDRKQPRRLEFVGDGAEQLSQDV